MTEEEKATLADLLNRLPVQSQDDSEAVTAVAWLAGLNWSDDKGWVAPGDE